MKWLVVVWRPLVVVWSCGWWIGAAQTLCPMFSPWSSPSPPISGFPFPPSIPPQNSPSRPSPSSFSFFLTLSEIVAIISILLYHYNSSGNVRSFSRRVSRRSGPLPRATHSFTPFIIVFHDISRFFLLQLLRDRQRGESSFVCVYETVDSNTSVDIHIGINSEKGWDRFWSSLILYSANASRYTKTQ